MTAATASLDVPSEGDAMPRDDNWEDDDADRPRRRRDRYEEDDDDYDRIRRRGPSYRSGSVTSVGVIGIILGSLVILFALCMFIGVVVAGDMGNRGAFAIPGFGGAMAVLVVIMLLILLWGILALVAGIGILNRKQWARVMMLILSGMGAAAGLLFLIGAIGSVGAGADFQGARGAGVTGALVGFLIGAVLIGFCIQSYVVLLNSQNGSEFH